MIKHAIYVALACCLAALASIIDATAYDRIIRPYQSVRSAAMGGVQITTGFYDENFYGNPARVTQNPNWKVQTFNLLAEVNPNTIDTVSSLVEGVGNGQWMNSLGSASGKNHHGRIQTMFPAYYLPSPGGSKMSYAAGVYSSTQFDLGARKSYIVDPTVIIDSGFAFTIGRKFLENETLLVGLTTLIGQRTAFTQDIGLIEILTDGLPDPLKQVGQGAHIDFNLGGQYVIPYKPKGWTLTTAVTINQILGGTYDHFPLAFISTGTAQITAPKAQPRTLGLGVSACHSSLWKFADPVVALEVTDIGNNENGSIFRLLHIGGETRYSVFLFRLGMNQGYFTAGLGIDFKFFELDMTTYGEELTLNPGGMEDRSYAMRLAFDI